METFKDIFGILKIIYNAKRLSFNHLFYTDISLIFFIF